MMFAAFHIVFKQERGWSEGIGGVKLISIAISMIIADVLKISDNKQYMRVVKEAAGEYLLRHVYRRQSLEVSSYQLDSSGLCEPMTRVFTGSGDQNRRLEAKRWCYPV